VIARTFDADGEQRAPDSGRYLAIDIGSQGMAGKTAGHGACRKTGSISPGGSA
jgi:hypothetical protein